MNTVIIEIVRAEALCIRLPTRKRREHHRINSKRWWESGHGLSDCPRCLRLPADGEVDMVISQFPPSGAFRAQLTKSSCDITEWRMV